MKTYPSFKPSPSTRLPSSQLFAAAEYVAEAIRLIDRATTRITLFTMIMTEDASTEALITALCRAAERGVKVRVANDIFTLGVMSFETQGAPWRNSGIQSTKRMRKRLRHSGVSFTWIGQLGPILYARRTHVKWFIIDDDVFSFGGVNLYKNGINNIDYMLLFREKELADRLDAEHSRIQRAERTGKFYRSHSFACRQGTVLIDGGVFNNSIIYERVCMLAAQASRVLLVSQYMPTGRLGKLLDATDTDMYYNRWQQAFGMNKFLLRLSGAISKRRTKYTGSGYIHAKFMIFTMPDGNKVALSGSHNFEHGGVLLGTREIALETRDPGIIAELEEYFHRNIAQ